jgi:hypothetical protein
MAWIEVHQALFTHRKVMHLADQLGIPEVYACAHLISLWTWALDNAPDGALNVRCTIVARASRWMGDADALVHALCETGFLDEDEDGIYYIHDWDDYAGRLVEKRRQNRDRMREARSKPAKSGGNSGATHVQRTLSARAGATVPNPTQPNSTKEGGTSRKRVDTPTQTSYPDDFEVTADMYAHVQGKHPLLDIETATEIWRNSMQSNTRKYRYTDWRKAWYGAMDKAADWKQTRGGSNGHKNGQSLSEFMGNRAREAAHIAQNDNWTRLQIVSPDDTA